MTKTEALMLMTAAATIRPVRKPKLTLENHAKLGELLGKACNGIVIELAVKVFQGRPRGLGYSVT